MEPTEQELLSVQDDLERLLLEYSPEPIKQALLSYLALLKGRNEMVDLALAWEALEKLKT
jgi:hypothetical protein